MSERGSHIATLIKPHGYKGEMQVKGRPHLLENIQTNNPLFISIDGQRIPFFVEGVFAAGQADRLVVKFEFIDDIEAARKYINCKVYSKLEQPSVSALDEDSSELIGYHVVDRVTGKQSVVVDYVKSDENPILILEIAHQEIMLPLKADYIESVDHSKKLINVSLPEGLINL